jgi:hypothetical protein
LQEKVGRESQDGMVMAKEMIEIPLGQHLFFEYYSFQITTPPDNGAWKGAPDFLTTWKRIIKLLVILIENNTLLTSLHARSKRYIIAWWLCVMTMVQLQWSIFMAIKFTKGFHKIKQISRWHGSRTRNHLLLVWGITQIINLNPDKIAKLNYLKKNSNCG